MKTREIIAFIEAQRIEKSISKKQLCDTANVNDTTYWRYLQGLEPPFCTVVRLLKAIDMDLMAVTRSNGIISLFDVHLLHGDKGK